jgi:hypothetical protein
MTDLTYRLTIPADRAEQLQEHLQEMGVPLDPRNNLMAWNDAFRADCTATGDEVQDLIEAINAHLVQQGLPQRVRTDQQQWSLPELQQFLQFSVDQFYWAGGAIESTWWEGDPQEWEALVNRTKWLFQDQQE